MAGLRTAPLILANFAPSLTLLRWISAPTKSRVRAYWRGKVESTRSPFTTKFCIYERIQPSVSEGRSHRVARAAVQHKHDRVVAIVAFDRDPLFDAPYGHEHFFFAWLGALAGNARAATPWESARKAMLRARTHTCKLLQNRPRVPRSVS